MDEVDEICGGEQRHCEVSCPLKLKLRSPSLPFCPEIRSHCAFRFSGLRLSHHLHPFHTDCGAAKH